MPQFPSGEWFDYLAKVANDHADDLAEFGFSNIRLACKINGLPDGDRNFGLIVDGFDVLSDGEIDLGTWHADVILEGPAQIWFEVIGNIVENGRADLQHTLNTLTLPEIPMRIVSDDPLGRDLFFRYNETLQAIFDLGAKVPTELPVGP